MKKQFNKEGFTLIEVILVIALMGFLAGLAVPVYLSFQDRQELAIAATQTAQTMRRAQMLAQGSEGDISWGVYVESTALTLYKGASYGARDNTYDEIFAMPQTVSVSGGSQDVVFDKFSGQLGAAVSIDLTSNNNETKTITINQMGILSY